MSNLKLAILIALPIMAGIVWFWPQGESNSEQPVQNIGTTLKPAGVPIADQMQKTPALPEHKDAVVTQSPPVVTANPTQSAPGLSTPEFPDETPASQMGGPETTMDLSGPEQAPGYGDTGEPGLAPEAFQSDVPGLAPQIGAPDDSSASPESSRP